MRVTLMLTRLVCEYRTKFRSEFSPKAADKPDARVLVMILDFWKVDPCFPFSRILEGARCVLLDLSH
jgi:hypothetical protein